MFPEILLHVPLIPKSIPHYSAQLLSSFIFSWLVIFIRFTSLVIVQILDRSSAKRLFLLLMTLTVVVFVLVHHLQLLLLQ